VIQDPLARGRVLAALHAAVAPSLFGHLAETGLLPAGDDARARAREEWELFSLYACVRGLVAACGFGPGTAEAIDAFHLQVLEAWVTGGATLEEVRERRDRMKERYEEYGVLAREGGASGAKDLIRRLGDAAVRHMTGAEPSPDLAELAGALHESLAEGAAAALQEPA
jgi:hypothetical protein